mmetsp:Transcript_11278/g.24421  ORF Transcript_11278/g.24421 Transcript_11278/m.24421 type:complete len:489 (-) Transcript_11278:351-1817(-)
MTAVSASAMPPWSFSKILTGGLSEVSRTQQQVSAAFNTAVGLSQDRRFPTEEGLIVVREEGELNYFKGSVTLARCITGSGREFALRRLALSPAAEGASADPPSTSSSSKKVRSRRAAPIPGGPGGSFVSLEAMEALVREADLMLAAGQHPHVLRCYASVVENSPDAHCRLLLCDLCSKDLASHVAASQYTAPGVFAPSLSPDEVAEIGQQLAAGLGHLHCLNILAGQVTSTGVLCGRDGLWKLGDFKSATRLPIRLDAWRAQQADGGSTLFEGDGLESTPPECRVPGANEHEVELSPTIDTWLLGLLLADLLLGDNGLAASPAALQQLPLARVWLLLHWAFVEDSSARPWPHELAALLGGAAYCSPAELLESLPEQAHNRASQEAKASARQLAIDLAAAEVEEAGRRVDFGRLAELSLVQLRQELTNSSAVDALCLNCGLEPDTGEPEKSRGEAWSSPTIAAPSEPLGEAGPVRSSSVPLRRRGRAAD